LRKRTVPYLRALLVVFAAAVVVCVGLYFRSGNRKYLAWAGRLFVIGTGGAVAFFAVLLVQQFT
jgi:hypothetical protein